MLVPHVAVWLDRNEAKILHFAGGVIDAEELKAPHHHLKRKAKDRRPHAGTKRFFDAIAKTLEDAQEILVVGPSSTKLDFLRRLHKHDRAIERRVLGVETLERLSDLELAAYVQHYFRDRGHLERD